MKTELKLKKKLQSIKDSKLENDTKEISTPEISEEDNTESFTKIDNKNLEDIAGGSRPGNPMPPH